jgi:hypothetical protein
MAERAAGSLESAVTEATGASLLAIEERRRAAIRRTFTRLDAVALGAAVGTVLGAAVFLATLVLALRGGDAVGPRLALLSHYFPGYEVSAPGALAGLLYGAGTGFLGGFLTAAFRNLALRIVLARAIWGAERSRRRHLLDEVG